MQIRAGLIFALFCILFVVLIVRLFIISYSSGEEYEKIVLAQQQGSNSSIPYQRGDIVDRKGTVMATSLDVYNVILDCKQLNSFPEYVEDTVKYICQCFPEISEEKVRTALSEKPDSQYVILAKKVSYEETEAYREIMDDDSIDVAGVWFEKEYIRMYPYGALASSTIGFGTGTTGVIGLEAQYNSTLNGTNGRSYTYYNEDGDIEESVVDAINGNTIVTSIDVNIQSIVEQEILKWNQEYMSEDSTQGSKHTAVLVMDPNSGEILAMANYPTFDLNNPRDLTAYFTDDELMAMTEDEQIDALNSLWSNFCISYTYEPGSTAKPFTVAAGLESGALTGNETYECNGYEVVDGYTIHCVSRNGHGTQTIRLALMNSCNDALMQIVRQVGPHYFSEFQKTFGFGQKTGIDLPSEASTANLIYSEEELTQTASNLATNSFGQNFNVTMVQLASAFCSLINGGTLYQPHLVTSIQDESGNTVETIDPVVLKKTVSYETSETMRELLEDVVSEGTGKTAGVEGYSIGGKTGTEEKYPRGNGNYLVSFIGFVPADDPQFVIYTIIDEPNTEDQAHSSYAQTITSRILEQILPYLNIKTVDETDGTEDTEATETETQTAG